MSTDYPIHRWSDKFGPAASDDNLARIKKAGEDYVTENQDRLAAILRKLTGDP